MAWQAALSAIGSASSTPTGVFHSAIQNKKQRRWAEQQFKHRLIEGPGFHMRGLAKAGLNPILAASLPGGAGGGMAPQAGMIGAGPGIDPVSASQQAQLRRKEMQLKDIELKTAGWRQKQAYQEATASEFLPQRAGAAWRLEHARAQIAEAGVPRARAQEMFLGDLERELSELYYRQGGVRGMLQVNPALRKAWDWMRESEPGYKKIQRWRGKNNGK